MELRVLTELGLCLWFLFGGTAMAAETSSSTATRKLNQTPTWAVAAVCTVFILISIFLEKGLEKIGTWLEDRHKKALVESLEKVKSELMILGFISLLLSFGQSYVVKICISTRVAETMLPCPLELANTTAAEASSSGNCADGKVPLISVTGLHELHILVFFLAILHVIYSALTMMLGRLKLLDQLLPLHDSSKVKLGSLDALGKGINFDIQNYFVWLVRLIVTRELCQALFSLIVSIRGWKEWEQETSSHSYEFSNDPSRFRLTHETSFVRAHSGFWTRIPFFFYVGCFFRQFFKSVTKADYLTLRNGFITVHLGLGSQFNFQKYIKRSLEDDFKVVVGVSPVLWASFVIFLLINVDGWRSLLWASLLPVIIILAIGMKLQAILTRMALEITEKHAVVQGIPLVQGSDRYFWFGRPQLILHLLHFALFQNAFQITYFLWIWYSFGLKSCFHADVKIAVTKAAMGLAVLFLCSYSTLPLYALVTQMGSCMKKSIFDEQTSKALRNWQRALKRRNREKSPTRTLGSASASPMHRLGAALHRFKTTGHSARSAMATYEESETSDYEGDTPSRTLSATALVVRVDGDEQTGNEESGHEDPQTRDEDDFSFVKAPLRREP